MSNPDNQRADGCSIFFTFLVLALLLTGFYIAQKIFEPEAPVPVSNAIDQVRSGMVAEYRKQHEDFVSSVSSFHVDRNSTLESSMKKVLSKYQTPTKPKPIQQN